MTVGQNVQFQHAPFVATHIVSYYHFYVTCEKTNSNIRFTVKNKRKGSIKLQSQTL